MSETLGVYAVKNRFSELIDRVEKGEEIIVTRHGKAVARVTQLREQTPSAERAEQLVQRFRHLRDSIRASHGPVTQDEIKSWIKEGQR